MRFLELNLRAYGPFTDCAIDLSRGHEGLHVIYGPNEAGKSTTLRAVKALFYGFPHHRTDDFLHKSADLRVGARLRGAGGEELACFRRKGRKNTLLDGDDQPIDEGLMAGLLNGVTAELMSSGFVLSHEDLVRGGRDLVEGKGDVGESLFAAGLGSGRLRGLLRELEDESNRLFRPRGQKHQSINSALSQFKAQKKLIVQLSLPGREWQEHRKALERARKDHDEVTGRLGGLMAERQRIKTLLGALPRLAERDQLLEDLAALGDLPPIEHERFAERRREAMARRAGAIEAERQALDHIEELERQVARLSVPETLLELEPNIDDLHQRLGSHLKAAADRTRLRGELDGLQLEARKIARDLWPGIDLDAAGERLISLEQRKRIRELGRQHKSHDEGVKSVADQINAQEQELEDALFAESELDRIRDVPALRRTVEAATRGAGLEEEAQEVERLLRIGRDEAALELKRLGLWAGSPEELEAAPVPDEATIDRFENELSRIERDGDHAELEEKRLKDEHTSIREQIAAMELGGVVQEDDLVEARQHRHRSWRLVRRSWLDGEDVAEEASRLDPSKPLAEVFEGAMSRADEVADRLRREAERSAELARLRARHGKVLEEMSGVGEVLERLDARREAWEREWAEVWERAGLVPHPTPREMRAWLTSRAGLLERCQDLRDLSERREQLRADLARVRLAVAESLAAAELPGPAESEPLVEVAGTARVVLAEQERLQKERVDRRAQVKHLERSIAKAKKTWEGRNTKLKEWQERWAEAVAPLELSSRDPSPDLVEAILEKLELLDQKTREAATLEKRIKGIDRDAQQFVEDLRQTLDRAGLDLSDQPPDQAATQLYARLQRAQRDAATLDQLKKRLEEQHEAARGARRTAREMARRQADLCAEAGADDPEELPELEERVRRAAELRQRIRLLEKELVRAGGTTLAELMEQAAGVEAEALPASLEQLQHEIDALEGRRSALDQTIGSERAILESMDASDQAAEAAAEAEAVLAKIRDDSERYLRLRLAHAVLRREIERFRQENQGPLLQRASEIFRRITLGSFSGLETHYHEQTDEPVLRSVRRGSDERLEVGALSDGTQDQLYLALRLASVERYIEANEPTPLVFDDILILFDDDRSLATLEVLAELSSRTQVLFFTHHRRLVELAERLEAPDQVFVHALPPEASPASSTA